ncbi:SDR family oxidoreductase [uncultured Marinobacter sp.]|uniref:SDR family oxidoreductase n=1 Tax=uncultured Marinobacter sp. TaxID=187379 RepID=UPI0026054427|nr:SDR family oxidoreductase [uncultured Marinobacter sp.]
MNLLITGATGFIGRHLCACLTARNYTVVALMRRPDDLPELRARVDRLGGSGDLIQALPGDLSAPGLGISESLPPVDAVIHLGARFAWQLTRKDVYMANVEGSLSVAELARRLNCRLVFISGFMLENLQHLNQLGIAPASPEQTNWQKVYRRAGAYEASKLEAALKVRLFAEQTSLDMVEVQPATVAGQSQTGELDAAQPLYQLLDNLSRGRLALVPGTPEHWLPLTTVDHLAAVIAAAAIAQNVPERLLCLDPDTPTLQQMLAMASGSLGIKAPRRFIPLPVLRAILSIPGVPKLVNTYPEALHFIQAKRFDTANTERFLECQGLFRPNIASAIEASVYWYQKQRISNAPAPGPYAGHTSATPPPHSNEG